MFSGVQEVIHQHTFSHVLLVQDLAHGKWLKKIEFDNLLKITLKKTTFNILKRYVGPILCDATYNRKMV